MSKSKKGICYLAGAGPGDPGLVTVKVRECLERADAIIYDYLCNPEILRWARPEAEMIYAGKRAGAHTMKQAEIGKLLVKRTRAGDCVLRLKGGDPYLFGRGGEEAQMLAEAGLPFEVIPGVSSAIAGPAYAGIPVTHREHSSQLTIFTGHEDPEKGESSIDYAQLTAGEGTKVMLMGVERLERICAEFLQNGASPALPVALIRWATTSRQQTLCGTLATIAEKVRESGFAAPAVAVFGEVVSLRSELNWFERRPLFGKRMFVTRTRAQAGSLSRALSDLGAEVWEMPTIRIEPPDDLREFAELVKDVHGYDWLIFTSPNGVEAFFEMFFRLYNDVRSVGGIRIAAIGPATAERVKANHLAVDLQPEDYVAEGLIRQFQKEAGSIENLRILLARAASARDVLPVELTRMGAIVDLAVAYKTVPETDDPTGAVKRFREDGGDLITFTSSSTVENFMAMKLPLPARLVTASIGPVTSATMRQFGLEVSIEAERHDVPGLVAAISDFYGI